MIGTERISGRQLLALVFILHSTVVISILPSITTADSLQDAWLSTLVALVLVLVIAFFITGLTARFPREDMVQFSIRLLGPYFLTVTPISFIIFVMVFASAVAAICGLEVIARVADLLFVLILILVISTLLTGLPKADFSLIQPVLSRGWGPVGRGAVVPTAMAVQLGSIMYLTPHLVRPQRVRAWVLGGNPGLCIDDPLFPSYRGPAGTY